MKKKEVKKQIYNTSQTKGYEQNKIGWNYTKWIETRRIRDRDKNGEWDERIVWKKRAIEGIWKG